MELYNSYSLLPSSNEADDVWNEYSWKQYEVLPLGV